MKIKRFSMAGQLAVSLLAPRAVLFSESAASERAAPIYKAVVAEGVGDAPQSAVKNATENALRRVRGSYVDSETVVTEHRESKGGKQLNREIVDNKIREYANGVVKDIDILNITIENGVYVASVRVTVMIK